MIMERADFDYDFARLENGKIIGVCLGYSHCSEHEWGIKRLRSDFGLNREKLGFKGLKNTIIPKELIFYEGDTIALAYSKYLHKHELEYLLKDNLEIYSDEDLATAWYDGGFAINVTKDYRDVLKNLYDAFLEKNGIIAVLSGSNPIAITGGLVIMDYTKIPYDYEKEFKEKDRKKRELNNLCRKLEDESGVFKLLRKSGKKFMALSIHRIDEDGEPWWWLNPWDQHIYNSGWYRTKDLKKWAKNKGPIIKKKEDK